MMRSWMGQPSHNGPRSDQSRRSRSPSRMNAPLVVPTSSWTSDMTGSSGTSRWSETGLERVDDPLVGLDRVDVGSVGNDRVLGLVVEHGRERLATGLADAL